MSIRYNKASYVEVATVLRFLKERHPEHAEAFDIMTSALADMFERDSPAFRRGQFIRAASTTIPYEEEENNGTTADAQSRG